jgi:hypothetical protein
MTLTKPLLVKLIVTRYIKSLLCPFYVSHFKMKQNRKHRQNIDFMYLVINQIFYFIYILIFSTHVNKSYRDFGKVALWSFNYTMILPNLQPIKTYTNDSLPMTSKAILIRITFLIASKTRPFSEFQPRKAFNRFIQNLQLQ